MPTKTAKLSPAQVRTLDKLRHAVPMELNGIGELHSSCGTVQNGRIHSSSNTAGTLDALAKKGAIETDEIARPGSRLGSWGSDIVRIADRGRRVARIIPQPAIKARVSWMISIEADGMGQVACLYGRDKTSACMVSVPDGACDAVAAILAADGWEIAPPEPCDVCGGPVSHVGYLMTPVCYGCRAAEREAQD